MSTTVFAVLGGLFMVIWVRKWMTTSLNADVRRAIESKDLIAVIDRIAEQKESAQPNSFNIAIRQLWDAYEREMAAVLVKELTERHPKQRITQYWLDQVQKVEPSISKKMFKRNFIQSYYQPEIAETCGSVG